MARKKYTQRYSEEIVQQLKLAFPGLLEEILKGEVALTAKQLMVNPPISLEGSRTTLVQFIEWMEKNNPILSGFGTLYKQHGDMTSLLYTLIQDLGDLRKIAKKDKFAHVNDEDKTLFLMYDTIQLTYKLLMNSLYGATIEKSSFFYNPYFGPAVTYTGVVIITTSMNVFEKFMSANVSFRKLHDILTYVNNIIKEDYNPYEYVTSGVDKEIVIEFLYSKLMDKTPNNKRIIKNVINGLSEIDTLKVYLKNNIYETIDRSPKIQEILKGMLGNTDFLDPNEPPEAYMDGLSEMWTILDTLVHYDYLDFYRYENSEYGERKTILTVDTDSNFLYLYPFFKYCKDKFNIDDTEMIRMTTTNVIMFVLTSLITKCYQTLTKAFGIQDESQRKLIAMKNEFYYSRIMLTNSKKNYSGIINLQEGNILEPAKHDIKGLAIKKVSTNKEVRKEFTRILQEDILSSKEIDVSRILSAYSDLEDRIRESLLNGELSFAIPGKVNAVSSYKDPYTQQTVRGSLIWNALYPNKEIVFPEKVNFVKLKDYSYEEICTLISESESITDDEKQSFINALENCLYSNEKMAKYGFRVLCIPKSVTRIPEWLIPFINVNKMIEDNMRPGFKMLESLEFNILSYQVGDDKGEVASNIVNI